VTVVESCDSGGWKEGHHMAGCLGMQYMW